MTTKLFRFAALTAPMALVLPAMAAAAVWDPGTQPVIRGQQEQARERPVVVVAPGARARAVMGRTGRAWLGVQLLNLTEELREFYGAPEDAGTLISRVEADSPAAAAGFQVGDVITGVNGETQRNSRAVIRTVSSLEPETEVTVDIIRAGAPLTLNATLGKAEGGLWFSLGGTPESEGFHLEIPDLEQLHELRALPDAIFDDEARETMRRAIEQAREQMSEFDYEGLSERLAEAEARLRELERKLAERQNEER